MSQLPNLALQAYQVRELNEQLQNRDQPIDFFYFEELESTNDFLLNQINGIKYQRAVAICQWQTNGRGRFERKWQAIESGQITLSYLYRSGLGIESFKLLSIACMIECLMVLEQFGFEGIKIKWPNDLYVVDSIKPIKPIKPIDPTHQAKAKKLAGILIDSNFQHQSANHSNDSLSQNQTDLVIGIGINLMIPSKLAELEYQNFASLEKINPEVFTQLNKNQIALAFIDAIEQAIENLESGNRSKYIDLFNRYDLLIDKKIHFQTPNGDVIEGINQGINKTAQLMIKKHGKQLLFSQGQILVNQ